MRCKPILAALMNAETQQLLNPNMFECSISSSIKATADEWTRAAGIYECVKKNAPGLTDAIQKQLTTDHSTPAFVIFETPYKCCILLVKRELISKGNQHVPQFRHWGKIL
jgi:hypothetical protein